MVYVYIIYTHFHLVDVCNKLMFVILEYVNIQSVYHMYQ